MNKITGYINGQRFNSKLEFDKIIDAISKQVNPEDLAGVEVSISSFIIRPSTKTWYKQTSIDSDRLHYAKQDLKFGIISQEEFNTIEREERRKLEHKYIKFKQEVN